MVFNYIGETATPPSGNHHRFQKNVAAISETRCFQSSGIEPETFSALPLSYILKTSRLSQVRNRTWIVWFLSLALPLSYYETTHSLPRVESNHLPPNYMVLGTLPLSLQGRYYYRQPPSLESNQSLPLFRRSTVALPLSYMEMWRLFATNLREPLGNCSPQ